MTPTIAALAERIRQLEGELEVEFAKRAAELHYGFRDGVAHFEREILDRHRQFKVRLTRYVFAAPIRTMLVSPVIYAMIAPLIVVDLAVTLYQAVCFPVYGIAKARRADYFVFDRANLAYLNALEKLNCAYCSYANGLIGYTREIISRTEQYWCPIKHARRVIDAHPRADSFVDYGDAERYRADLPRLRKDLA